MRDVLDLITKMGEKEDSLTEREFISPIFYNTQVATRVSGIIYKFKIKKVIPGWYKFKLIDSKRARRTGEADFAEIDGYFKHLDKVRMILTFRKDDVYLALPEKNNKFGLEATKLIPVFLFDDSVMDFDKVLTRTDGVNFWFESVDMGNDPMKADFLRTELEKLTEPDKIRYSGLTFEEKAAYAIRTGLDKKFNENRKERVLRSDVEHAGGKFLRFTERKDHFSVTYKVEGEEYTSYVTNRCR